MTFSQFFFNSEYSWMMRFLQVFMLRWMKNIWDSKLKKSMPCNLKKWKIFSFFIKFVFFFFFTSDCLLSNVQKRKWLFSIYVRSRHSRSKWDENYVKKKKESYLLLKMDCGSYFGCGDEKTYLVSSRTKWIFSTTGHLKETISWENWVKPLTRVVRQLNHPHREKVRENVFP